MFRAAARRLARTSRRGSAGGGGWTHPTLRDTQPFAAGPIHSSSSSVPHAEEVRGDGGDGGMGVSGTVYAADNPSSTMGGSSNSTNSYRNNWKAAEPMPGHFSYVDFRQQMERMRRERGSERHRAFGTEKEGSSSSDSSGGGGGTGATTSHHGTASMKRSSWRGGASVHETTAREGGGGTMFPGGRPRTITDLCRQLIDAAFVPRESDSKLYGGDGATERAQHQEELKHLDPKISPIFHPELMADTLRSVQSVWTPSGALVPNGREMLLKGRIVGLLFFSESERSLAFMRRLQSIHATHHPDLVVVCISLANSEMRETTRGFGFYHLTHRDGGATWVQRDVGLEVKLFSPLPRLVVVEGSGGKEITRSGVTQVVSHPHECVSAWCRGEAVECSALDYMKTWYLADE